MDWSVSPKDEIWFLRVCHHISNAFYQWLNPTPLSLLAVVVLFTCIQLVSGIVTVWWTEVVQNCVRWYQWLYSGFSISYSDYCFPLTKGNKKSVGSRALFAGLQASSAVWLRSSLFFGCYTALVDIFRRFGNCQLTLRNVLEERRLWPFFDGACNNAHLCSNKTYFPWEAVGGHWRLSRPA